MKKIFTKKILIRICITILIFMILSALMLFIVDSYVGNTGAKYIRDKNNIPKADAIIILGAYVLPNGKVSDMLADRLNVGLELYIAGKAPKIIVSGDHGQVTYDEVNNMRKYLVDKGVKIEDIFMDHAGFCTYDSIYRAKEIFLVKKAIIVTQEYHLRRALYISEKLGFEAYGVTSDKHNYGNIMLYRIREIASRFKAFLQAGIFHPSPKYLGKTYPISGDGRITENGK